jgi:hypothetical protein
MISCRVAVSFPIALYDRYHKSSRSFLFALIMLSLSVLYTLCCLSLSVHSKPAYCNLNIQKVNMRPVGQSDINPLQIKNNVGPQNVTPDHGDHDIEIIPDHLHHGVPTRMYRARQDKRQKKKSCQK